MTFVGLCCLLIATVKAVDNFHDDKRRQGLVLQEKVAECLERNSTELPPDSGLYCPLVWDGIYCWPHVRAGSVHRAPCPTYVDGFKSEGFITRVCTDRGTWFFNEAVNDTWSNYTECFSAGNIVYPVNKSLIGDYLPMIKSVSKYGYAVSFGSLLIAFFVLAFIKRLRCPRNNLHMHLFVSFILRAFVTIMKSNLFIEGVGLAANVVFIDGKTIYFNSDERWDCKVLIAVWQYFLMANYCWILMEGLYLHNLIFLALLSDSSGILMYAVLGWGLPVLFIIPWAIIRTFYEDTLCWTTHSHQGIFWIIRGPITISIVVNFIFFLNITRILFLKLKSSYTPDSRKTRYKKLARSTLVLVPLFGVHYTVFLVMSTAVSLDELTEVIWLFCDQFFTAFQGFFVAILYCFMNGEVQAEVCKKWQRYHLNRGQISSSRTSLATQSLTLYSRTPCRNSLHSLTSSAGNCMRVLAVTSPKNNRSSPSPVSSVKCAPSARDVKMIDPFKRDGRSATPSPSSRHNEKLSCLHRSCKTPSPKFGRHAAENSCSTSYSYCHKLSDSSISYDRTAALLPCPSPGLEATIGNLLYDRLSEVSSSSPFLHETTHHLTLPTAVAKSDTSEDSHLLASPMSDIPCGNRVDESTF